MEGWLKRFVPAIASTVLFIGCAESPPPGSSDAGVNVDASVAFRPILIDGLASPAPNFFAVWGTSERDIFIAGERGTIVHFDGTSWAVQPTPTTVNLRGLWGRVVGTGQTANDVFAVGDTGVVLRLTQGVWVSEASTTAVDLHAVAGRGGNRARVYAVGVDGVIATRDLMTTSARWVLDSSPTRETLNGIWVGTSEAVAVGNLGSIVRHDGNAWQRQRIDGLNQLLYDVWGESPTHLWITGLDGTLLRSTGRDFREVEGAPKVYLRRIAGLGSSEVYFSGWGGTIGRVRQGVVEVLSSESDHRLEGIWATSRAPDGGIGEDAQGVGPAATVYVVGVTGTVLVGP